MLKKKKLSAHKFKGQRQIVPLNSGASLSGLGLVLKTARGEGEEGRGLQGAYHRSDMA